MKNKLVVFFVFMCVGMFPGCGSGKSADQPASADLATAPAVETAAAPVAAHSGLQKIGDMADAWNELFKQNEAAINNYDGMPIMALVTPPLTFVTTVQFDLLNPGNQDGRFEGKLMFAGYNGFVEKSGTKIVFGFDHKLDKDGFGPLAKAGDRMVENGSLDLAGASYRSEEFTERAGRKISRGCAEFKRLEDGSMVCLALSGKLLNMRGDEDPSAEAIFVHNGAGRYDFVVAKSTSGPEFKNVSFSSSGDLTKAQAIELFRAAGYEIQTSGGIEGGKLVLDK